MNDVLHNKIEALLNSITRDDKLGGGMLSTTTLKACDVVRTQLGIDLPQELAG